NQLADYAEPVGRGVRWLWSLENDGDNVSAGYMSGWCHGSAGYVFLWTLAHRCLQDPRYLALAERAGWNAWEDPSKEASLCCGLAGRAYGLLSLYKHTGEQAWLSRARDLTNKAAIHIRESGKTPNSLYRGEVGVALLAAEIEKPEWAAMPFFEEEQWRRDVGPGGSGLSTIPRPSERHESAGGLQSGGSHGPRTH
ncbi:MAG: hypothetical protein K0S78_6102, partial [Thermomicrobiales bacterium]|nr:hypothetical protein [Thermomicrobiales bacterium]